MIVLIVLPFIVFMFIILVFSMMRGLRRVGEIRLNRSPLTVPTDRRKPSDDYHDQTWLPLCARIADAASSKLKRPLTAKERRNIWRARTALVLEILLKEVQEAANTETVASLIANLPPGMDRPDPTGWCGAVAAPETPGSRS